MSVILITGASGFIGKFLVEELIIEGYSVIAISRSPSPFKEHPRLKYYSIDITDRKAVERVLSEHRPEVVIHLAALLADVCESDPNACYKVNLESTYDLIKYSILNNVGKFLFASSFAVYHPNVPEPVKEEYAGKPLLFYGITKYACELIGLWYDRRGLIDFRALRPTVVFGPGRIRGYSAEYSSLIIDKALRGEEVVIKNPNSRVNYVYVKDVVRAFIALLKAKSTPSKVYNVGGFTCRVIDFLDIIRRYIPTLRYKIAPQPVVEYPAEADISRAKTELGWSPIFLYDKAIEDYIETIKHGGEVIKVI